MAPRPMRRALAPAAALAILGLAAPVLTARPATAQQAQIYDPQPPPDSAYVRFVNTLGEEVALRPSFLPAQRLGTKPEERISVYHVAPRVGGNQELSVEASAGRRTGRVALRLRPGTFNTILLQPQGDGGIAAAPIVDEADFNRARSRLSFYNAANCPTASVSLAPSGPAVLEGVASNAAKARSVNPVTAELRAECAGGQAAPSFPLQGLEAGGMYSIWLMRPDGRGLTAFFTRDTTARWRN